jgi:hypothetical protein
VCKLTNNDIFFTRLELNLLDGQYSDTKYAYLYLTLESMAGKDVNISRYDMRVRALVGNNKDLSYHECK